MYHKICVYKGTYQICCGMCMLWGRAVRFGMFCVKSEVVLST